MVCRACKKTTRSAGSTILFLPMRKAFSFPVLIHEQSVARVTSRMVITSEAWRYVVRRLN